MLINECVISCVFLILGWTGVNERTFVAVKPDGVQRKLVGEIMRRFEKRGFKLVGLKLVQVIGMKDFYLLLSHYFKTTFIHDPNKMNTVNIIN